MNEPKLLNAIINNDNERIIGAILTPSFKDFQNFINSYFYIRIKEGNIYFIDKKGEKTQQLNLNMIIKILLIMNMKEDKMK